MYEIYVSMHDVLQLSYRLCIFGCRADLTKRVTYVTHALVMKAVLYGHCTQAVIQLLYLTTALLNPTTPDKNSVIPGE